MVKITDSDAIKDSENELIDGLIGELDWQVIETILKEKYNLSLHDDVEYKSGDIVVHGKKIAYKLNFDVRVTLSLLVGRDGECFDIKASGSGDEDDDAASDSDIREIPEMNPVEIPSILKNRENIKALKNEEMAAQIAGIINEIND